MTITISGMKNSFFRLLLSTVLMMCCTVMANAQIDIFTGEEPQGSGTQSDPYKIDNYGKLYRFSLMVNAGYYSPAYAELTADITADGVHPWIPIGNDTRMYVNEFNGNGYVISGLTINNGNSADACCLGLFGKIGDDGSVHDVGVESCYFYGHDRVGAICGDLAEGEVYNCWSSGYICVNSAAGGLVGSCWYNSKLRNCYTTCNVVVSLYTDQYVGGVCGSVAGKVENCYMLEKTSGLATKPIGATYGETSVISNVAAKPASAFSSGEVCWQINGGVTDGSQGWYQTIGTDNMPTSSKSSKTVSRCRAKCTSDGYFYNNDNVGTDTYHALAYRPKYSCVTTGYDTEYWECLGCHKLFADRECNHEISLSDLGEAKSALGITKDEEWQYADTLRPDGCSTTLNSCYYINIPAPEHGTKTTSISFTVNANDIDFSLIWFYNQWGIPNTTHSHFYPDAIIAIKYMVNGETIESDSFGEFTFGYDVPNDNDEHYLRSHKNGTRLGFGILKKGDVVKIEISLTDHLQNYKHRNNQIVFSIVPAHQFKHVNEATPYREHWECGHCHNLFSSNAHPDSDEDICSLDDLAYEEPTQNDGYYEISNEGTLYWFARQVNEYGDTAIRARLTADIKVNNNVLDRNGNLNDASSFRRWTPIGTDEHPFVGVFGGNGHTISGLYQKDSNHDAGLFGYMTTGGKIENVIVNDSYLFGWYPYWADGRQGHICYRNWGGSVTDSYISMGKVLGGYVSVASNSERKVTDAQFNSGEATWMLNGEKIGNKWRQQIGRDLYPVLTGNYLVNHSEEKGYYNETMCEVSSNHIHIFEKKVVEKCDNSVLTYWQCSECGKDFTDADRTKEETDANKSAHRLELVKAVLPTYTSTGHYGYWHCTHCGKDFLEDDYSNPVTSEQLTVPVHSNNNEIWYTSTNNQKITPHRTDIFGATYNDANNRYEYGLGVITFDNKVTSIGEMAFNPGDGYSCLQSISIPSGVESIGEMAFGNCFSLQSINIPSGVTSIGKFAFSRCGLLQSINIPSGMAYIGEYAFTECGNMESVTFHSLPNVDSYAFYRCSISSTILDLTDSDKPYIGTSLDNYPAGRFTEARYHRTLEPDKWGTIVLPFKPSAESTANLKFYALQSMTTGGEDGGTLTFTKVDAPEAGIPYLFRNEGESADFTLTAETPSYITLETQEIGTNFKMKGSFKAVQLDGATDKSLYYLKDNEFYHANGKINIFPFRAYIEGNSVSTVQSFMLVISDNGEDITAVPGIVDGMGEIDETEAIYDLSGHRLDAPVKGQVNIIRLKSGKTIKKIF